MYFSKATLNLRDSTPDVSNSDYWKFARYLSTSYGVHKTVWDMFSDDPEKKRDFLYREEERNGVKMFYLVSQNIPLNETDMWAVESKPYDPKIYNGSQLKFSIRANPVVIKPNKQGSLRKHSVVMDAKIRCRNGGQKIPPTNELVNSEGLKWLAKMGERHGFTFNPKQVAVVGYNESFFYKPIKNNDEKKINVKLVTMDFTGLLTVTDEKAFKKALFDGIGPSKSFGCGLLMIKHAY